MYRCTALHCPAICTVCCWVQVYRGQQLAWAAQLELVPVAVRVTSLGGVRGMIVALDETGGLLPQLLLYSACVSLGAGGGGGRGRRWHGSLSWSLSPLL